MSSTTDHLSENARELFDRITTDYELSVAETAVLVAGLIALDESERCRQLVLEDGPVTRDRFGQWVRHPAATHGRDCRNQFMLALKQLGLADRFEREVRESRD